MIWNFLVFLVSVFFLSFIGAIAYWIFLVISLFF